MKNFLQFMIPLAVICVIGFIMMMSNKSIDDDKKLYIKCDGSTKSFEVHSGVEFEYQKKDDPCYLEIEVANVDRNFIKLNTPYLWRLNHQGEIDNTEPRNVNVVEIDQDVILYSYDQKTKFVFQYK